MANIVPFEKSQMPAHIADAFGDDSNIEVKQSLPALTFRGKVWRIVLNNEETILTKKDQETGESVPRQMVDLVVVGVQKGRSRAYFEGAYDPNKSAAPVCWSSDSQTPDADVKEPQSKSCANCKWSAKGSRISDNGKPTVACTTIKRLAVVPATKLDFEPLLLKLPITSIWDKEDQENAKQGWYAWDQYSEFLVNRGVKHTASVVTAVKFDNTAHPKLLFKTMRWCEPAEVQELKAIVSSDKVQHLIAGNVEKAYVQVEERAEPPAAPAPAPAAAVSDEFEELESAVEVIPASQETKSKRGRPAGTKKKPEPEAVSSSDEAGDNDPLQELVAGWDD